MVRPPSDTLDGRFRGTRKGKCGFFSINLKTPQGLLKKQLSHVQTQVLETRKLLDMRRHYDAEVNRWISSIKTDLSQVEFVAQVSHNGKIYDSSYQKRCGNQHGRD